jgi:hypothetical protein
LRGLCRARRADASDGEGERQDEPPEREERLCLISPDGRERISFYRRSDGLWDYVVEVFAGEEHSDMGYIPGYWYPAQFSGLHDSLATARREAAGGRAWVLGGEGD